ncbi:hypothetical protein B0H14DRAFT_2626854 [Mycena olivaceomarginata]|nr:hypothetical protein B0H14DRAFT_2626854 [Mycena olivaceomarginata]
MCYPRTSALEYGRWTSWKSEVFEGMESSRSQENSRHTMEDPRGAWPQKASPMRLTAHSGGLQARHKPSSRPQDSDTVTGEDLEKLKKTNESLVNGYGLKHSAEQQKWAYGKMTAYSSRIPKGGRRGNTYHAYAHILADTGNDLHTLFDLAKASTGIPFMNYYLLPTDTIRAIVETIDPDAAESHVHEHRAGSDGDNNVQLCTKTCWSDEFNFSYTEWGILVKTVPGCIWVFNARDMHQVTLPRRSSLQAANGRPMSSSSHITVSTANANKARAILRARRLHRTTAEYWRNEFRQ